VAEICAECDPALRPAALHLLEELRQRGVLGSDQDTEDGVLSAELRARFREPVEFLRQLSDEPQRAFDRFRRSHVLLVGGGVSFRECAAALVRNGLRELWLVETGGTGAVPAQVAVETARLAEAGLPVDVRRVPPGADIEAVSRPLSLLVHVADRPSLPELVQVRRWFLREGCWLLPGLVLPDQSLLGPLLKAPGCWVCTLARVGREILDRPRLVALARLAAGAPAGSGGGPVNEPLARELGKDAAFEAFKMLAGHLRPRLQGGLVRQRLTGDGGLEATFVPHGLQGCLNICGAWMPR
jgi:hypothetical protein